jgi:hypothetical protein
MYMDEQTLTKGQPIEIIKEIKWWNVFFVTLLNS